MAGGMEAALNGLATTVKHNSTKEAITQAKGAVKALSTSEDVSIPSVREKCLAAFELAFDKGNDKAAHYAVEGVQSLLRDPRFHSISIESTNHSLPTQVLSSMTGVAQWNSQLQCHCLTLLVEMVCSSELRISLQEVEECLEMYMRVFGSTHDESARVSARAAISQSITAYCCNRYAAGEKSQNALSVYIDVTKLLESYVAKLDHLTVSSDHSVVLFDAVNALLTAQPISVVKHTPFVNLLWEKLCPLMIRLLGVPDKNITNTTTSTESPLGQGQIAKFTLSPAVIANPEATRLMYQILEQLLRIMAGIPSMYSVLEALFHKAFLFPKIEQRTEAIRSIKKMLSDRRRLNDIVSSCVRARSLSLWRMLVVCMSECAQPQYEISIETVRACDSMLQGVLDFCVSTDLVEEDVRWKLKEMFPTLADVKPCTFTSCSDISQCSPHISNSSTQKEELTVTEDEVDDEMDTMISNLAQKFSLKTMGEEDVKAKSITAVRMMEKNESTEKVNAQKFVDSLVEHIAEWSNFKSTLEVDDAILEFSSGFYNDFSAMQNEAFKSKSNAQLEFLNTDAIYITVYSTLCLALRGDEEMSWTRFRDGVLKSGCIVYVSESWLRKVYEVAVDTPFGTLSMALLNVLKDYDGLDRRILTDVERLQQISLGKPQQKPLEELIAARWLVASAWDSIVHILSTFLGIKDRHKVRQKVQDGIEFCIKGMQLLAAVALELELAERCGWIFEKLVESSCDVDELRTLAGSEDQERVRVLNREDLLSMQLILDNAFVSIHAPDCWKHVIRCSEYIWELEKFIYGALCYEKPSRFSFSRTKRPVHPSPNEQVQGETAADRSVENAVGNGDIDKDSLNKALCILIAKVDRFYSKVGHELNLRSLRELCVAITAASENRIFYSGKKAAVLTPTTNLLTRISEILSSLGNRPLVHQMLVWPIVCKHFVQVASSPDESRMGVMALSDTISSLILSEPQGLCFNQMLIAPFQGIACSDTCSLETREQVVAVLADFVKTKWDRIGSGWKTLFGTFRAVRTSKVDDASVHWTVLDVIGAYLRIEKYSVLSWSLPDCFPCIVHFLQSSRAEIEIQEEEVVDDAKPVDDQLSEAALRLITPTYTVILNLFKTAHIANPNLLHRAELRAESLDEVECAKLPFCPLSACLDPALFPLQDGDPSPIQLDASLEVPLGDFPWAELPPSQVASLELLLSLVEHLSGTLITAPPCIQSTLLVRIQQLISTIKSSEFGLRTACFCLSTLLLPHIQKWIRRSGSSKVDNGRSDTNLRQAVGISTQMVLDILCHEQTCWHSRLLLDICRLATECTTHSGDLPRVGAACLRHLTTVAPHYTNEQWTVLSKSLWDATSATLASIRLLLSVCLCDSTEKKSDLGEIMVDGIEGLPLKEKILAQQVFLVDAQKEKFSSEKLYDEVTSDLNLVFIVEGKTQRMSVTDLISSLLAHQLIVQLIGSILCPCERVPEGLEKILVAGQSCAPYELPEHVQVMLHHCLDASFQIAVDFQRLRSLSAVLSKAMCISRPNLYKQLVSTALIKMYSLLLGTMKKSQVDLSRWCDCHKRMVALLRNAEVQIASKKLATITREHKEEKFEFMLVESEDQKLYRIVSENDINNTILEYQKQRPMGLLTNAINARPNPFRPDLMEESGNENEPDYDTLCLLAYRQICLVPVRIVLSLDNVRYLLPQILDSVKELVLATPDIAIRKLAVQIIEMISTR